MTEITPIHAFGILLSLLLFLKSYQIFRGHDESVLELLLWASFGIVALSLTAVDLSISTSFIDNSKASLQVFGVSIGILELFAVTASLILIFAIYIVSWRLYSKKEIDKLNQEIALLKHSAEQNNKKEDYQE